jgi:hypothetical protein
MTFESQTDLPLRNPPKKIWQNILAKNLGNNILAKKRRQKNKAGN